MSVTIKDIARLAGVSISTVSRILNNNEGFISQSTKENVLRIVEEQKYSPNVFARSLVTARSKMIGIIIPDIVNPFFPELIRGCDDTAHGSGYGTLLCNSDDVPEKETAYLDFLFQRGIDGILLAETSVPTDIERLNRYNIPIVTMERQLESCACLVGCVDTNNKLGAYLSAEHLIKQGHRHIVFLCGSKNVFISIERFTGFREALEKYELQVDPDLVHYGTFQHSFGYTKTKELLASGKVFTAICCMSDDLALGAMAALREAEIKIPSQCAVMGYDNTFVSTLIETPLSTINRSSYDLGRYGVELLLGYITKRQTGFVNKSIDPFLITRKTS
jgi:LacI family transcriptional regulator